MTDTNPAGPDRAAQPAASAPTERLDDTAWPFGPEATTPAPATTAPTPKKRLPARFGTIFWGVLLLVFAGFMVTNAIVPLVQDPVTWLIGGLIAAGAVLVIAGIAAAIRRTD